VRRGEKSIERVVEGQSVELQRSLTTARWTFLIDPSGGVVYVDSQVSATKDLSRIIAAIAAAQ
jgi:peroxiredoxin